MASSYKMKGIFKGFKIISQIFAAKEQEMQIGCPMDVKHVAHIGWNASTGNAPPSWMNDIRRSSDFASLVNLAPSAGASWASQDFETPDISPLGAVASGSIILQDAAAAAPPRPPKKTRRRSNRATADDSPATSSVSKDSSASADDTSGSGDMVTQ